MDAKGLEHLSSYVEAEYSSEWLRKSGLETRAFALITANIALITIALTLADKLGRLSDLKSGLSGDVVAFALVCGAVSTLCALGSALPMKYPSVHIADLENFLKELGEPSPPSGFAVLEEIVEARLVQLKAAQTANDHKADLSLTAFVFVAVASMAYLGAIVGSV